jgi:hypothetical protein
VLHCCNSLSCHGSWAAVCRIAAGLLLVRCSTSSHTPIFALQEGQYEREGYGQRPYDNWETIMFDCEKQVRAGWEGRLAGCCCCCCRCLQAYAQEAVLAAKHNCQAQATLEQHLHRSSPSGKWLYRPYLSQEPRAPALACPDSMAVAAAGVQDGDVSTEEQQ